MPPCRIVVAVSNMAQTARHRCPLTGGVRSGSMIGMPSDTPTLGAPRPPQGVSGDPSGDREVLLHRDTPRDGPAVMLDLDNTVFPYSEGIWATLHPDRPWEAGLALHYEKYGLRDLDIVQSARSRVVRGRIERYAGPYAGATEAIRAWREAGIWVGVCTHRAHRHTLRTQAALDEAGIEFDDYVGGGSTDKLAYCQKRGIDVVVDDHPHFVRACSRIGIPVVSLDYGWLRAEPALPGVDLVPDWDRLGQRVLELLDPARREAALTAPEHHDTILSCPTPSTRPSLASSPTSPSPTSTS